MTQIAAAPRSLWGYRALVVPILMMMVLVLGASNLATVLSASFHDLVFDGVYRALLIAGANVADSMTHKSLKRITDERVRARTAALASENDALKATGKKLSSQAADLEARHAKAVNEVDAAKQAHGKTQRELADLNVKRSAEAARAKRMASSVRGRLVKGVARNNAAIPAEAIPYVGISVTVSLAALDVYDACQTMKEINELMKLLGQGEESADVCGTKIPTVQKVLEDMRTSWKSSAEWVAKEAKSLPHAVPIPEVRLPTTVEAKAVLCPLVGQLAWLSC